jgi:DDE family transposase
MLLDCMVARQDICLRRLSEGRRAREVGFHRLLANDKVTVERLIEGWSEQTVSAVAGRHVLAIQDTSEINFATTPARRRGLGEIGKGGGRGVLVHAMVAVEATRGSCLGLVAGSVYTRKGRVKSPHAKRSLKDKESRRWIDTAIQAKTVLAKAATVTIVADRESDIYAEWATLPGGNLHLLTRVMHDRAVAGGGTLSGVMAALPFAATRSLDLLATHKRAARCTEVSLRFGNVEVCRPNGPDAKGLAKTVSLTLVEVIELHPPEGVEPVHWRLLTTHDVTDVAAAWQIVDWYRLRWVIEQLFRLMKTHGLRIEDSQLTSAETLIKLAAIATKAAAVTLQLVQARDGKGGEPASNAFSKSDIAVLDSLDASYQGRTALQKNPHVRHSLAWATWIIARLGGWDGYPSSKPPGPITLRHGLEYFRAIAKGWALRDVCMP